MAAALNIGSAWALAGNPGEHRTIKRDAVRLAYALSVTREFGRCVVARAVAHAVAPAPTSHRRPAAPAARRRKALP